MKKNYNFMIIGMLFAASIIAEFYFLLEFRENIVLVIGGGVIVLLTTYLLFDWIQDYFVGRNDLNRETDKEQITDKTILEEILKFEKASYLTMRQIQEMEEEKRKELQEEMEVYKEQIFEAGNNAAKIVAKYHREDIKYIIKNLRASSSKIAVSIERIAEKSNVDEITDGVSQSIENLEQMIQKIEILLKEEIIIAQKENLAAEVELLKKLEEDKIDKQAENGVKEENNSVTEDKNKELKQELEVTKNELEGIKRKNIIKENTEEKSEEEYAAENSKINETKQEAIIKEKSEEEYAAENSKVNETKQEAIIKEKSDEELQQESLTKGYEVEESKQRDALKENSNKKESKNETSVIANKEEKSEQIVVKEEKAPVQNITNKAMGVGAETTQKTGAGIKEINKQKNESQNPNHKMSPEEIAALISSMNSPEEKSEKKVQAIEKEIEKPKVEDSNRQMSPEEIAALFASMK